MASADTTLVNKEIETSVQALGFDIKKAGAGATADETAANVKAIIAALCGNCTVTVTRQSPNGSITFHQAMKLSTLLEVETPNDVIIRIDNDDTDLRLRGTINLSLAGSLTGNENQKILLNIAGKVTGLTIDIYAMDTPLRTNRFGVYKTQLVTGGTTKDIDTSKSSVLMFPIDELTDIECFYNNGISCKYTQEEVKFRLMNSATPIVMINGRYYMGYLNFANWNCQAMKKVTINLATTQTVFLYQQK